MFLNSSYISTQSVSAICSKWVTTKWSFLISDLASLATQCTGCPPLKQLQLPPKTSAKTWSCNSLLEYKYNLKISISTFYDIDNYLGIQSSTLKVVFDTVHNMESISSKLGLHTIWAACVHCSNNFDLSSPALIPTTPKSILTFCLTWPAVPDSKSTMSAEIIVENGKAVSLQSVSTRKASNRPSLLSVFWGHCCKRCCNFPYKVFHSRIINTV